MENNCRHTGQVLHVLWHFNTGLCKGTLKGLNYQREVPQLLCPCPMATSKCENVTVFSVILIENVSASCKIFSSLFLFASLFTAWFPLKIE